MFAWFIVIAVTAYMLGFYDGWTRYKVEAMKGTYDSGDHEDRVEDYPEDWT